MVHLIRLTPSQATAVAQNTWPELSEEELADLASRCTGKPRVSVDPLVTQSFDRKFVCAAWAAGAGTRNLAKLFNVTRQTIYDKVQRAERTWAVKALALFGPKGERTLMTYEQLQWCHEKYNDLASTQPQEVLTMQIRSLRDLITQWAADCLAETSEDTTWDGESAPTTRRLPTTEQG